MRTPILLAILLTPVSCSISKAVRLAILSYVDPRLRPSEKTTIEMAFDLTALNKLDSVHQELETTFLLYMRWKDPRLIWNQARTSRDNIVFYADEIWTPPLTVSNAIDESAFLLSKDFPLRVNRDGTVTWIPRISPKTICDVKTSTFPVDTQRCNISITSWVLSTDELTIVKGLTPHYRDEVTLDFYTDDNAWDLLEHKMDVIKLKGGYGIEYQQVNFKFEFKRHKRFYWVLLVIPGICLASLQPLVFLLPLDDKDTRVMFASTILLSLILYTNLLNDILPPIFRNHVLGETFAKMIICGTVITALIILEVLLTSVLKTEHTANAKELNNGRNAAKPRESEESIQLEPQPKALGQSSRTEGPGQSSQTEVPGQSSQTEAPGQPNQTGESGVTAHTRQPAGEVLPCSVLLKVITSWSKERLKNRYLCHYDKGRRVCYKCFILKLFNVACFIIFLGLYSDGIKGIRCELKETC